jgi:two-component system response regulator FixJ
VVNLVLRAEPIVYIIEPDESIREGLTTLLGIVDMPTQFFPHARAFLDSTSMESLNSGCLIIDAELPGFGCLALLKKLRNADVSLPVFVLANTLATDVVKQTLQAGATDVILKPLVAEHLLARLQQVLN